MRIHNLARAGLVTLTFASLALASCNSGGVASAPRPLTDKQAAMLTSALKDRVAGEPVDCISSTASANFTRISDDIMLYSPTGRVVFQNRLPYSCRGLARDDDVLVIETTGSRYCKGDTIRLVDRNSGFIGNVCRLGQFTPYKRVRS
jgi:hypothetical protein